MINIKELFEEEAEIILKEDAVAFNVGTLFVNIPKLYPETVDGSPSGWFLGTGDMIYILGEYNGNTIYVSHYAYHQNRDNLVLLQSPSDSLNACTSKK